MCAARRAVYFISPHAVAGIRANSQAIGLMRLPEAGPTAAGVELVIGVKQDLVTADTVVNPVFVAIPIGAGKGRFGTALAADLILFGCQFCSPFGIGFFNDLIHL
jgi:hypothetical protein